MKLGDLKPPTYASPEPFWAILVPLPFHIHFRIILSVAIRDLAEIFIEIVLNLYINLGRIDNFTALILPIHKHKVSLIFFLQNFMVYNHKCSVHTSCLFTSFAVQPGTGIGDCHSAGPLFPQWLCSSWRRGCGQSQRRRICHTSAAFQAPDATGQQVPCLPVPPMTSVGCHPLALASSMHPLVISSGFPPVVLQSDIRVWLVPDELGGPLCDGLGLHKGSEGSHDTE